MLKDILKLNGTEELGKNKQAKISGGFGDVVFSCEGVPDGTPCLGVNGIQTCINGYCDC